MKINLTLLVIVLALLTACAKNIDGEDTAIRTDNEIITNVETAVASDDSALETDMGEIYGLALDAFLPLGDGLTDNMKYIAIDMSNLKDLSEGDKEQVLRHFSKYDVNVMDITLEQLEKEGQVKDARSLEGILLRVENSEILGNKIIIEGSLFKSAKGAIGTSVTLEFLDDKWQVTKASDTWMS
ncbi:peptide ABC transporter substrate-binding protein [Paenibacillus gansuensis]|uniref:Peptide ABC transporter substrate-binding protein n=1 Tax=Paenibacillus gansuensis TaxID=306542 RepID=A0ABW5PGG2_9BACL